MQSLRGAPEATGLGDGEEGPDLAKCQIIHFR
jgi:hypothetical protein